ncbi:TonB-dependent receptor plug domain-containing protein [Tsuneonella sp. HG222]
MRHRSVFLASAATAIVASVAFSQPAFAQDGVESEASVEGEEIPQNQIIVTGTRRSDRTVADSPVPIDVIGGEALTDSGYTEVNKLLNQLVPSFNFPQPSLTDGTDALRPATLRGLAPDQTLVLVNGKRRHTSALLNMNGSVGRGSAAVDLNTIPPLAIERIEVLRDGASSQYGSDAIAGVINVQLRKSTGARAQATYGKYITTMDDVLQQGAPLYGANGQPTLDTTAGAGGVYLLEGGPERKRRDGATLTLATNFGVGLGQDGYLNLTAQYQDRDFTDRSAADPRQQYPNIATNTADPREKTFDRFNHRFGDPKTKDFNFFMNWGYDLSPSMELYGFGSYGLREGNSAGFYRRANDARNRNFSASTTTFVPYFADGFLPLITSEIEDFALAGGLRGDLGSWNFDLSAVTGSNAFQFGVIDTFNVSFGNASQNSFDAGKLVAKQTTVNFDLQRDLEIGIGTGTSFALGAEYRDENFQIQSGDLQSYAGGLFAGAPFFGAAGAQVFPGFRPANETDASRDSWAVYSEIETDFADMLTLQLAGRYEKFSDFGDTLNGKAAARFEPVDGIALRGSISTGFRAPSLHQQYYSTTSTNNVNGTLVDILTVPVNDPVAVALGSKPLKAEESLNWSGGLTFSMIPGLNITADYYNIQIDDRIVVTETLQDPTTTPATPRCFGPVTKLLCAAGFNNVTSARFFINGIDTKTKGLEVVANYRVPDFGAGRFNLTAGYNWNKTSITSVAVLPTLPGLTLFGRQESLRLTEGQPRNKVNFGLDWDSGIFGLTARANRYGSVLIPGVDAARDQRLSPQWVADLEVRAQVLEAMELAVGANNVLDSYPDRVLYGVVNGQNYGLNGYFLPYSAFSPAGFNGRYVYGRVSVDF